MPAAASALLGLVKYRINPRRLYLSLPTLMPAEKTHFFFPPEKNPAISSQLCHETTQCRGRGCHRLSSSLSQQEKPNPLRGRGGPRLNTSTKSNFEASLHHSPQVQVPKAHPSPQRSKAGENGAANVAAPNQGRPKPCRATAGSDVPSRAHLVQAPSHAAGRQY